MSEEYKSYCGIDVGSENVRCIIARAPEKPGELPHILGVGKAKSFGVRRGVVIDPASVAQSVDEALAEAEKVAGVSIESATFSVNGLGIETYKSSGVAAINHEGPISEDDVEKALSAASLVQLPNNSRLLEVLPVSYSVDGQDEIQDPTGMVGSRVEANVVAISAPESSLRAIEKVADIANVAIGGLQPSVRMGAEAILSREEREIGVLYIDLGGQTTSLAVFEECKLRKIVEVAVGSSSVTNDLAIGLKIEIGLAEKIKKAYSELMSSLEKTIKFEWEDESLEFKVSDINLIVEARLEDIFRRLLKKLKKSGQSPRLPGGVILSGEGALIDELDKISRSILKLPSKLAKLECYKTSTGEVLDLGWSSAIGLVLFDDRSFSDLKKTPKRGPSNVFEQFRTFLFRSKK